MHLFAIFDGHGGSNLYFFNTIFKIVFYFLKNLGDRVSKFCAENFGKLLKDNENYKNGRIEKALKETCLQLD